MSDTEMIYRGFVPDLEIRSTAKGGDGRTVDGIAVPYGKPQRINSELTEQFAHGSAAHQVAAWHRVKFAREHLAMGGALIGRGIEAREDTAGLWTSFRASKTPAGDETLELIRDGALDELSVGFRTRPRGQRTIAGGVVERTRVDYTEVAVVLQGAYGRGATVKGLRSEFAEEIAEAAADPEAAADDPAVRERLARLEQMMARLPLLPLAT